VPLAVLCPQLALASSNLAPRSLVRLWECLLLEMKVLVVTDREVLLCPFFEALTSLIMPLPWAHTTVPILVSAHAHSLYKPYLLPTCALLIHLHCPLRLTL
jgi:hypothetical protein